MSQQKKTSTRQSNNNQSTIAMNSSTPTSTTMYHCHRCSQGQILGATGSKCMICGHIVCSQCRKLRALQQALLDMHISDDVPKKKDVRVPQPLVLDIHANKMEGGPKTAVSRMKADELKIQQGLLLDIHVNSIDERSTTKVVESRTDGTTGRH